MDMYQPALNTSLMPMLSGASGEAGREHGAGVGPVSSEHLPLRPTGGPRRDVVVELGGGPGRSSKGLKPLEQLGLLEGYGLYNAGGRMTRPVDGAQPGSEARLRDALEDLGLSHGEIEDFLQVSQMLARVSPDAARRLEEGLRAMASAAAQEGGAPGDRLSPAERLGGRNGYALDYMRLEFSYTEVSERMVTHADGSVTREVSATQIDLSFERLEVAFRGKADDAPAFLALDGDDLSFGAEPPALAEALPETDVAAAGLKALLDALSEFRLTPANEDDDEAADRFGLKRLGEGSRQDRPARAVDLLFA